MARKLTILLDDQVYARLHAVAGKRRVGRFVEGLVRDRVLREDLESELRGDGRGRGTRGRCLRLGRGDARGRRR